MNRPKISLFFGAGAEMPYGLPSGGEFALNIFRLDSNEDKKEFKEQLKKIDSKSPYARKWLPKDYLTRPVSVFNKKQYESLIISSLENKREHIFNYLNQFDNNAEWVNNNILKGTDDQVNVNTIIEEVWENSIGSVLYGGEIEFNPVLGGSLTIFDSKYFSALLGLIASKKLKPNSQKRLKEIVKSFFELMIGAVGEDFLDKINYSIFEKKSDDFDFFDDFYGLFKFDYKSIAGLDLVLNERSNIFDQETVDSEEAIVEFAQRLLDGLFAVALDYQNILDSYYRYLFCPKTDWGKFTKISIFLKTVRRYITQDMEELEKRVKERNGYYQDLADLSSKSELKAIGTANYNHFLEFFEHDPRKIYYLNGSVNDFYDPYKNSILTNEEAEISPHLTFPFLFTQSGIKPLTSVTMSRRYVELFDKYKESNVIGVLGFSFQADDGHINGLFRELLEEHSKKVVIFHHGGDRNYAEKLRLTNQSNPNLIIEPIDNEKISKGMSWYEKLIEHAQQQETES